MPGQKIAVTKGGTAAEAVVGRAIEADIASGALPAWARDTAAIMLCDAYELCERHHAGRGHRFKRALANAFLNKWRYERAETGSKAVLAVVVMVVGGAVTAATGGLAAPILVAMAAGGYALGKARQGVVAGAVNHGRRNRDWLANAAQAATKNDGDSAIALATDASDGIRRAVDHYRKARDHGAKVNEQVRALRGSGIGTCDQAVNLALATTRFVHEVRKAENYLLPCIDMTLFVLEQHTILCKAWNAHAHHFGDVITQWLHRGDHGQCDEVCYAPRFPGGRAPRRRLEGAAGRVAKRNRGVVDYGAFGDKSAEETTAFLRELRDAFEQLYTAPDGHDAVAMAQAGVRRERRGAIADASATGGAVRGARLLDAVYKKVDHPGSFVRVGHYVRNAYTRSSREEKAGAAIGEVLELASLPASMLGAAQLSGVPKGALETITKGAIKGGISGAQLGAGVGVGVAMGKSSGGAATTAAERDAFDHSDRALKASGAIAESLFKKAASHLVRAIEAIKEFETDYQGTWVVPSCDAAMGAAEQMCVFIHHMDKAKRYINQAIEIAIHVGIATLPLAHDAKRLWGEMNAAVAAWVGNGDHGGCRAHGSCCYGPRHETSGGGLLRRGPATTTVQELQPHKPL